MHGLGHPHISPSVLVLLPQEAETCPGPVYSYPIVISHYMFYKLPKYYNRGSRVLCNCELVVLLRL